MLKFQTNYITTIQNFEDFILVVFVLIDDLYQTYVPVSVTQRRNVGKRFKTDRLVSETSFCYTGCSSTKGGFSFDRKK